MTKAISVRQGFIIKFPKSEDNKLALQGAALVIRALLHGEVSEPKKIDGDLVFSGGVRVSNSLVDLFTTTVSVPAPLSPDGYSISSEFAMKVKEYQGEFSSTGGLGKILERVASDAHSKASRKKALASGGYSLASP